MTQGLVPNFTARLLTSRTIVVFCVVWYLYLVKLHSLLRAAKMCGSWRAPLIDWYVCIGYAWFLFIISKAIWIWRGWLLLFENHFPAHAFTYQFWWSSVCLLVDVFEFDSTIVQPEFVWLLILQRRAGKRKLIPSGLQTTMHGGHHPCHVLEESSLDFGCASSVMICWRNRSRRKW